MLVAIATIAVCKSLQCLLSSQWWCWIFHFAKCFNVKTPHCWQVLFHTQFYESLTSFTMEKATWSRSLLSSADNEVESRQWFVRARLQAHDLAPLWACFSWCRATLNCITWVTWSPMPRRTSPLLFLRTRFASETSEQSSEHKYRVVMIAFIVSDMTRLSLAIALIFKHNIMNRSLA